VTFVDALIAFEINQELHGKAFLGYASMRFTQPSKALLGMQMHPTTCAIEVAGLKDVTGTQELIDYAVSFALNRNIGGVLHWGQRNDSREEDIRRLFPSLPAWRNVLAQFTNDGQLDGFSNDFTRRTGLEA
jgi:hypothetical protein